MFGRRPHQLETEAELYDVAVRALMRPAHRAQASLLPRRNRRKEDGFHVWEPAARGFLGGRGAARAEGADSRRSSRHRSRNRIGRRVPNWKGRRVSPHPVFFAKSAQTNENNRVEFWVSARKCKKVQKSAQEYENKGRMVDWLAQDFGSD